jgi:hypothetical protein
VPNINSNAIRPPSETSISIEGSFSFIVRLPNNGIQSVK